MKPVSSLSVLCILLLVAPAAADDPEIEQDVVFAAGEDGYHTFRIPSLIAADGVLLAFCEGRKDSGRDSGDIDLVLKRSTDGGRTWGELQVVWDDGPNTGGNPCPVVDRKTGRILLPMTKNLGEDDESEIKQRTGKGTRTVWICHSDDDGLTWSKPREITKSVKPDNWTWYATGPGVGIQFAHGPHAGRLVVPCDHGMLHMNEEGVVENRQGAHVIFSDDGGETWTHSEAVAPKMNECQVVELAGKTGGLLLDMRSYRGKGCRAQATSTDGGMTWTEPHDVPELIEPVCQASLIRHSWPENGQPGLLAFSNPADAKRRVNMSVRISADDGQRWSDGLTLHAGPSAYSCLESLSDGTVACLYERGEKSAYESIVIARVPAESVPDPSDEESMDSRSK
ncbi:MAG: sialidase family protein [Planctomycetaceae bacterium]